MKAMELKVWVDGVQRVVCGVTEFTTCQEVVIALAQAIGEMATANVVFYFIYLVLLKQTQTKTSKNRKSSENRCLRVKASTKVA